MLEEFQILQYQNDAIWTRLYIENKCLFDVTCTKEMIIEVMKVIYKEPEGEV